MTYARSRLYLGISCVGTLVALASAMLLFDVPHRALPTAPAGFLAEAGALAAVFSVAVAILLPFDLYGGLLLPRSFKRNNPPTTAFLKQWLRAVFVQITLFVGVFLLYRRIGSLGGNGWVIALFAGIQLLLVAGQLALAKVVSGISGARHVAVPDSPQGFSRILVTTNSEDGFTGGIAGLPGFETTVIPDVWTRILPERLLKTELARRSTAVETRSRLRGLIAAVGWNTAIFAAALMLPTGGATSVASLTTSYLYFLLLSFIGLLTLPILSRRGVFEVDRQTLKHAALDDLRRLATEVDRLTDDEPERSRVLESVFHPIPCVQRRMEALSKSTVRGAWNAARMTLFLSWAFGGPLARAVHCNIGRPDLWVFLPTD